MKKRVFALLLALALLPALCVGARAEFSKSATYRAGQFTDVAAAAWYAQSVAEAYEYGLIKGTSATTFSPAGSVTIAESLALACRLHSLYRGGSGSFAQGSPWYGVYVDYAVQNGIIGASEFSDYAARATRAQFAAILARALPADALPEINRVADGAIPDVAASAPYGGEVYRLYRAGVLTGNDALGTFAPASSIQRSAVAAIVTRMADPAQRQRLTLTATTLTSEQIYARCSPAVFYIELYDAEGNATASGSGFFIDANGTAVTNFHVISGASSAKILRADNDTVYDVEGVYDFDAEHDWAVIKIAGSGFPYLERSASAVTGGATVYAIGSPEGLDNTISEGLVSNPNRLLDGVPYIQTSAAISHGSSGGALLNRQGQVVGITSAGIESGENLGFALPISAIDGFSTEKVTPLAELIAGALTEQEIACVCLWSFVNENANDTFLDAPMYTESFPTEHGSMEFGLFFDKDETPVLHYREFYDGEEYAAYIYLSSGSHAHFASYFFYAVGSEDWDFYGGGVMEAPQFDGRSFAFEEVETQSYSRQTNEALAAEIYADMLLFLDYILEPYDFTNDIFGFVNV